VPAYFAVVPRGLEAALAEELTRLGVQSAKPTGGGVAFEADEATACAANLHSRLATRILKRLDTARYRNDDDLYKLAARTPWEDLIRVDMTLRVDVTAVRANLRSLNFATLRVKDGIVDRLRSRLGERPSIDTRNPGTRVVAFVDERHITLYLDLSGEPLFKRGWRTAAQDKGAAPLKENLAAGLLVLAGWRPEMALFDPFCGSGTIVIEAAQQVAGIAAGANRPFGFERLAGHDAALTERLRLKAREAAPPTPGMHPAEAAAGAIAASDIDPVVLAAARANALRAGLNASAIEFKVADLLQVEPPFDEPGMILCNPPYGQRISAYDAQGESIDAVQFGQVLRDRFGGWTVCMLSSERDLPAKLGMRERRRFVLFNGPIECRLFVFEVYRSGAVRTRRAAGSA
jgi:putative N6-adenine-specific DNA methylase